MIPTIKHMCEDRKSVVVYYHFINEQEALAFYNRGVIWRSWLVYNLHPKVLALRAKRAFKRLIGQVVKLTDFPRIK